MIIGDPKLIERVRAMKLDGALLRDGTFQYVVFLHPVRMRPIIRRTDEWMTQTVARRAASFDVVVNAGIFSVSSAEYIAGRAGLGPFPPANTTPLGEVVQAGHIVAGVASDRYYIAEILTRRGNRKVPPQWRYQVGEGNPPLGDKTVAGVGGVGPLFSNGFPFGPVNRYRPGVRGPIKGDPGARLRPYLVERSNAMFHDDANEPDSSGKVIIAYHPTGALLAGVQRDGAGPGRSLASIRSSLAVAGFTDGVFGDGSDSAMLWYKGRQVIAPGKRKDAEMTVAIGLLEVKPTTPNKGRRR